MVPKMSDLENARRLLKREKELWKSENHLIDFFPEFKFFFGQEKWISIDMFVYLLYVVFIKKFPVPLQRMTGMLKNIYRLPV